jgi:hypothetical protein
MNRSETGPVLENRSLLRCEPEYGALVCLTCNNAFPRNRIVVHLNHRHGFTIDLYGRILRPFEHETLAEDWGNLRRPFDGSAPIEGLKIRPGYTCMGCGHRTTSPYIAQKHLKCGEEVRRVDLQCCNSQGDSAYWIVIPSTQVPIANGSQVGSFHSRSKPCICNIFTDDIEPSLQEIAIEKMLQQEYRLQEKEESRRIEANASDDISIWHRFMQWTDTFRDKDLAVSKKTLNACIALLTIIFS